MSNFFNMWKSKPGSDKNGDSSQSTSASKYEFDDDSDSNWQNARAKTERMSVSRSGRYKERQRRRSSLFDSETNSSKMAPIEDSQRRQQQKMEINSTITSTATTGSRAHSRSGSNSSGNNQYLKAENNENMHNAKLSVGKNSAKERGSIDRAQNHKDLPLQSVAI